MNYEETLGRQIGSLFYLITRRLNKNLVDGGTGITADQFRLLTMLWKEDGIIQQHLAALLGRDRAGVTRMVDILEEQGIVSRIADKTDRRINLIYLTKKGRDLETAAAAAARKTLDETTKNFTETEEAAFSHLLHRAIENLRC